MSILLESVFTTKELLGKEKQNILIQELRSTAIYGAKICHFQDIATITSAVA